MTATKAMSRTEKRQKERREKRKREPPRRPENAFFLYRKWLQRSHPNVKMQEFSRHCGKKWRHESPEIRDRFVREANLVAIEHKKKYPDPIYPRRRSKACRKPEASLQRDKAEIIIWTPTVSHTTSSRTEPQPSCPTEIPTTTPVDESPQTNQVEQRYDWEILNQDSNKVSEKPFDGEVPVGEIHHYLQNNGEKPVGEIHHCLQNNGEEPVGEIHHYPRNNGEVFVGEVYYYQLNNGEVFVNEVYYYQLNNGDLVGKVHNSPWVNPDVGPSVCLVGAM